MRPTRGSPGDSIRWAFLVPFVVPDKDDPARPYLLRIRVIQTPWFGLFLHWIFQPDKDRDPHDHPWPWFYSLVLRGGYKEDVEWRNNLGYRCAMESVVRKRWSHHVMRSDHAHKIVSVEPRTMTLVLTGPKRRTWGFWTREGFVKWREYEGAV